MLRYLRYTVALLVAMGLGIPSLQARLFKVGIGGQYTHIMDAVQEASNGDTISVAPGTPENPAVYEEQVNFRGLSLLIAAHEIGGDWWDLDHPDPRATILRLPDMDQTHTHRSVIYAIGCDTAEIRGFTITGGKGTAELQVEASPYVQIRGGGLFLQDVDLFSIRKCIIHDNSIHADDWGFVQEFLDTIRTSGQYQFLQVLLGGGIYAEDINLTLEETSLINNSLQPGPGAGLLRGGALAFIYNGSKILTIKNSLFQGNFTVPQYTDPFAAQGGALAMVNKNNEGIEGFLIVENSKFINNTAEGESYWFWWPSSYGGAVYTRKTRVKMFQVLGKGNRCRMPGPSYPDGGTFLASHGGGGNLWNITLIHQSTIGTPYRAVILADSGSRWVVQNTIIAFNGGYGVQVAHQGEIISDYNDFWMNSSGNYEGVSPGAHDIFHDPKFTEDFHLQMSSPVIDSGTNCTWREWEAKDMDGNPRFVDGRRNPGNSYAIQVDMGAYEYFIPYRSVLECGDVNRDGYVDRNDPRYLYHYLAGDPGYEICPINVADVNEDGVVDMADYTYLDYYTQHGYPEPCNPPFGSGDKQALLAPGEPEVQNQSLTLPVYGYLEQKSAGYLLEFEVPEGFAFTGAELSPEAPAGLVLRVQEEANRIRLIVADTLAEDGLAYLNAGAQELLRLHLTYNGSPVGFTLTGNDLQFADTTGFRMISGFVTGGAQAYVTLRDLATRIQVVGSRIVQRTLRVSFQMPRTREDAEVALYDAAGRRVQVLYRGALREGRQEMAFDLTGVRSGVYFLRVKAGDLSHAEKVVVLR